MGFPIFDIALKLIDKVIPDPAAKAEAQRKLLELNQTGELAELAAEKEVALAQIEVNKVEAASEGLFKSGWRPAVGWVGAAGLAYQAIVQPLLAWASINFGWVSPPGIDTNDLMVILGGILGLGGFRSWDKRAKK